MIFRPSRRRDEAGVKTLTLRMALLALGAAFGLAGIATENRWLIYIAVGILAIGLVSRFIHTGD